MPVAFSSFEDFIFPSHSKSMYLEDYNPEEILETLKEFENNKSSDIPIIDH